MQNFQDSFEARKRSFIRAFSICMTVPLKATLKAASLMLTFTEIRKMLQYIL